MLSRISVSQNEPFYKQLKNVPIRLQNLILNPKSQIAGITQAGNNVRFAG